jgi:ABC-type sugar transport system ATPase subunit
MGQAIVRRPAQRLPVREPLSNLNAKLPAQMRQEIRKLQAKLGVT